ncbi:hypothetical protein FRC06_000593 [Ceratobasidium sp. 370]|nr:hypothetical protein FRC06_000593 [Ceratobasidium sp. 370]
MSCFTPDLDKLILHLQTLDDPVHIFCMISAIDKTGQFKGSEQLTSPNAALQYSFEALSTITSMQHACSEGQAKTYHDKYLNEGKLCPFASLLAWKHLTTHAKATARLPTVNWIDKQQLIVKGKLVIVDNLKHFSWGIIPELHSFLHNVLLFGLPLKEHYHWVFDRNTKLVDDFSQKDHTLYHTVITHPKIKKQFYTETNDAKIPIFFTDRQQQWLDHYMESQMQVPPEEDDFQEEEDDGSEDEDIQEEARRRPGIYQQQGKSITLYWRQGNGTSCLMTPPPNIPVASYQPTQ